MPGADDRLDVAFVSHRSNRTGAPAVLLELVREAVSSGLRCAVLVLQDGALRSEFEALTDTTVMDWRTHRRPTWARISSRLGLGRIAYAIERRRLNRRLQWLRDARIVYFNSTECVRILPLLPRLDGMTITHVHELRNGIDLAVEGDWHLLANTTHRFIAASAAVSEELQRRGVDQSAIATCYEFIRVERSLHEPRRSDDGTRHPMAAAMGSISARKGADLFVQMALHVRARRPDLRMHFRWIGSLEHEPDTARWMQHDIVSAGLSDVIELSGEAADPQPLLCEADVFVLTSREDPFPVACLEAAASGIPIAAFDCGGIKELLEGAALFVPVPRADLLAEAVINLVEDPDLSARLSAEARRRVAETTNTTRGAERILSILRQHLF